MFSKILKEKYSYLTNYFEAAIVNETHKLPHSIILYGLDTLAQYYFALNIAKILNCRESKKIDCTCTNCRWINSNRHPAIMTITKCDNKPSDDDTKKNISVAQVRAIKNTVSNTSTYHRVFIFCDVETNEISPQQKQMQERLSECKFPIPPTEDNEERLWFPLPLTKITLPEIASNALLKLIEEPPENVTFIFLTKDRNDLISTVVSRSQCFHVPSFVEQNFSDCFVDEIMKSYPKFSPTQAFDCANKLLAYADENKISLTYILCAIQDYLQRLAIANSDNKNLFIKIKDDIFKVSQAQRELNSTVSEKNSFEALFLKF